VNPSIDLKKSRSGVAGVEYGCVPIEDVLNFV
jgi:hypothetical protein